MLQEVLSRYINRCLLLAYITRQIILFSSIKFHFMGISWMLFHILVLHMDFFFVTNPNLILNQLYGCLECQYMAMSWMRSSYILLIFLHMNSILFAFPERIWVACSVLMLLDINKSYHYYSEFSQLIMLANFADNLIEDLPVSVCNLIHLKSLSLNNNSVGQVVCSSNLVLFLWNCT